MAFFSKKQNKEEPQNIDEILAEFKKVKDKCQKLAAKIDRLEAKNRQNIGKVGIVRFNPFEGFGGNQSFSWQCWMKTIAAWQSPACSRDGNRVCAKPIENGESQYACQKKKRKPLRLPKII